MNSKDAGLHRTNEFGYQHAHRGINIIQKADGIC
jgi:hypothetical protein